MDITKIITLSGILCALFIFLLLLVGVVLGGRLHERVYFFFFLAILFSVIGCTCELAAALLLDATGKAGIFLFRLTLFLDYAFGNLALVIFALWLYEYLSTKFPVSKAPFRLMVGFAAANIVFLAAAQTSFLYMPLTEEAYPLSSIANVLPQILPTATVGVMIVLVLKNLRHLKTREWISMLLYASFPVLCYGIESLHPRLWVSWLGCAASLFLLYVNIQADLRHELKKKELELSESRIGTMLSQIQPHFIFNSLSVINNLCSGNAEAQKAVIAFSEYLRVNMDSLTQKTPIPFEKELAHVKHYLWLEQQRYEERLHVFYDIQTADFMLPVLTVQPIVENAVRHGVSKRKEGGTVHIRSEDGGDCCRVVISDDGVGFDGTENVGDGRAHRGLENVRSRLSSLCGGQLHIESVPGAGTTAVIEIPKKGGLSHEHHCR